MENKIKLDFVGIGVMKGGTTYLSSILQNHPGVSIYHQKEISFYDQNLHKGKSWYEECLRSLDSKKICGEFSPGYIACSNARDDLKTYNHNLKVIAVFRNPVDRAFSHYLNYKLKGSKIGSFEDVLSRNIGDFKRFSLYHEDWSAWIEKYGYENCLPINFDDLIQSPVKQVVECLKFLGIKALDESSISVQIDEKNKNKNKYYRAQFIITLSAVLKRMLNRILPKKFLDHATKLFFVLIYPKLEFLGTRKIPRLEPNKRLEIYKEYFAEDIMRLERLDGRIKLSDHV